MQCQHCGGPVGPQDAFCTSCGAPVNQGGAQSQGQSQAPARQCPNCGLPVHPSMNFCTHCGTRVAPVQAQPAEVGMFAQSAGMMPNAQQSSQPAPSAPVPVPAQQQFQQFQQAQPNQGPYAVPVVPLPARGAARGAASGAQVADPQPVPSGYPQSPQSPQPSGNAGPEGENKNNRKKMIGIIVGVIVALLVVIGIVLAFVLPSRSHTQAGDQPSVSSVDGKKTGDNDAADGADGKSEKADQESDNKKDEKKQCKAIPDASVEKVKGDGTTLIATLRLADSSCDSGSFTDSNVRVNIKNSSGDVIAAAIYDFSKKPIEFKDGEATYSLAYTIDQYWQPISQMEVSDMGEVIMQTEQEADGKAAADKDGALGGANISGDDRERFAQLALQEQLDHDRSAASDFYSTLTDQLSSKKYDMKIEGKNWKYVDIYKHFLTLQNKHPKALLIWASDYSNYTKHGHDSDYYVILCGEKFDSEAAAQKWCSANGYTQDDCIPVDLE